MRVVLVVPVLILGLLVPLAGPVGAQTVESRARLCAVSGVMDTGYQGYKVGHFSVPPSPDWAYWQLSYVAVVCVGFHAHVAATPPSTVVAPEMTGLPFITMTGGFGSEHCGGSDHPLIGSFCGAYQMGGFLLGPNCSGTVGGPRLESVDPGNPIPTNSWSAIAWPVMTGGITCDSLSSEVGVISLIAAPHPLEVEATGGLVHGPYYCIPPPPGVLGNPVVYGCQLIVNGTIVFSD